MGEGMPFGEQVRAQRLARGWSVPDLARQIAALDGGDARTALTLRTLIRRWEAGQGAISGRWLPLVRQVFAGQAAAGGKP